MTWLMENPGAIITAGVLLELALAAVLLQTGRGVVIAFMVLGALATAGLLAIERFVVTDGEAVRGTLDQVAAALPSNDVDKVLAFVDPQAEAVRQKAKQVLPGLTFKDASIGGNVDMKFHRLTSPESATAEFFGHFNVQERHGGMFGHEHAVQRLRVELHKVDGKWLITDAQVADFHERGM